jgi:LuxR family transcriptional regulator, quorum-sensing system regulator BjaR1
MTPTSAVDLNVLEELLGVSDDGGPAGLKRRLSLLLRRRGIDCWLVTRLRPQTVSGWQSDILMNAWPDAWYRRYVGAGHYRYDPCVERSLSGPRPFSWRELDRECTLDSAGSRVMAEAREFGLKEGICVPLHVPGGASSVVTMAGEAVDDDPGAGRILHLAAMSAFWSIAGLHKPTARQVDIRRPDLTHRECEVLRWTAAGKTAWEVGHILGITETTTISHLRNARRKLGAANVVHAVVEALRLNCIHL